MHIECDVTETHVRMCHCTYFRIINFDQSQCDWYRAQASLPQMAGDLSSAASCLVLPAQVVRFRSSKQHRSVLCLVSKQPPMMWETMVNPTRNPFGDRYQVHPGTTWYRNQLLLAELVVYWRHSELLPQVEELSNLRTSQLEEKTTPTLSQKIQKAP